MATANSNPELIEQFCSGGTKEDIPNYLLTDGYSPENPNPNGYVLNEILHQIFNQLNHQKNKGFSFWESTKNYTSEDNNIDLVRRNNKIFYAKTNSINKKPETNPNDWGVIFDFDNPNEVLFAGINGSDTKRFKVAPALNGNEAINLNRFYELMAENEANQTLSILDTSLSMGLQQIEISRQLGLVKHKIGVK